MKIAIFGTGYVGLVTGVCFAEKGNQVTCVDIDQRKISNLQQGKSSIFEMGLEELLRKNIKRKTISFTLDSQKAIQENDIIFIAVGTPSKKDFSCDLRFVYEVADQIAKFAIEDKIIVTKSTIPVGTTIKIKNYLKKKKLENVTFFFVNNPEFLREGEAIKDCMNPDRIIIGMENSEVMPAMKKLYESFVDEDRMIFMDILSSELTKYAANAFLATKISFINQIAHFSEKFGANIDSVKKGISLDKRIGAEFLNPGLGYGGSCFPKDIRSLLHIAQKNNITTSLLSAVEEINKNQKERFIQTIFTYFKNKLPSKIAVWGLAFKANTDDIRDAPSLIILESLQKAGATLQLYDSEAQESTKKYFPPSDKILYYTSAKESLKDVAALVLCTDWDEFKNFDYSFLKDNSCQVIFDGRNILHSEEILALGIDYFSIGNKPCYSKK